MPNWGALSLHVVSHISTMTMYSSILSVAIVKYLSIYHGTRLDYADESKTVNVVRLLAVASVVVALLIDINFAPKNGFTFQLWGDPKYTR